MARKRRHSLRLMVGAISLGLSWLITAVMSLLFHGEVRPDMMATGAVCAIIIGVIVDRITRLYRAKLREVNAELERRVEARTADLEQANDALRAEMVARDHLQQQLLIQERMATAGLLAAGVGHEIRNPLTALMGNLAFIHGITEDLEDDAFDDAKELKDSVRDVELAAERIRVIVNDLAGLTNPVNEPTGLVDLNSAASSAIRLAQHELRKGCEVETALEDLPPAKGNASRLIQVFLNLLINAANAQKPDQMNKIRIEGHTRPEGIEVRVKDTGIGIAKADLTQILDPFFTTRRDEGGTGLGMHICRTIVEQAGGELRVESELGHGTTVILQLAAAESVVAVSAA